MKWIIIKKLKYMNEKGIKTHSFELANQRLKEFSETRAKDFHIGSVSSYDIGIFWDSEHMVRGRELNERIDKIHNNFIEVNKINDKIINEFRNIYNTFEALDKDYLRDIVANVKAIEKTSNDVRKQQEILTEHNNILTEHNNKFQSKLEAHQGEIDKILTNNNRTISILQAFQNKIESYSHLEDVGVLYESLYGVPEIIKDLRDEANQIQKKLLQQDEKIDEMLTFKKEFDSIMHLNDIDAMWDDNQAINTKLDEYASKQDAQNCNKLAEAIKTNKNKADAVITNVLKNHRKSTATIEALTKKVKHAQWIAGTAVGLVILELALILVKVI